MILLMLNKRQKIFTYTNMYVKISDKGHIPNLAVTALENKQGLGSVPDTLCLYFGFVTTRRCCCKAM